MSDSVSRCPRWWSGAEDRSEPIRQWVSEDHRSRAARYRLSSLAAAPPALPPREQCR